MNPLLRLARQLEAVNTVAPVHLADLRAFMLSSINLPGEEFTALAQSSGALARLILIFNKSSDVSVGNSHCGATSPCRAHLRLRVIGAKRGIKSGQGPGVEH